MIFLISVCVFAVAAANTVVVAPRIKQAIVMFLLLCKIGWSRISRNTPATTIVLECKRADTGVGPSMAEGSHGCNPICADFPVAAARIPNIGIICVVSYWVNSSCMLMDDEVISQAVVIIKPMSPMRL